MDKNSKGQQFSVSVQFFQIARSFAIRYLAFLRQKSSQIQSLDELQTTISRILNQHEANQVILSKLLSLQLRGDYHQVIALTLMQDLAKWSRENYPTLIEDTQYKPLLQSIIEQSIKLLNSQQQFHTIVPKQNDLLRELLITPHIFTSNSLEGFRTFYRKLKDVKEFYPQTIKQHQKIVFLKTVEESIEVCAKFQTIRTYEFIFHNIFAELEVLEPAHEFVTSRLKLMKKIVKNLWFFHEDILYKSAFVVMKFSQQVLTLPHLFSSVLNLYEDLMPILVQKISPAPLIIFNHLIVNNIQKMLQQKNFSPLSLEILLNSLTEIFRSPFIEYFMKTYDANFMQESICQSALNILFEFVENRANQKKPEYDIFKRYLKKATNSIRAFLNKQQPHIQPPSQKLQKFYEVKRKQYLEIMQDMNEKPKKIFKKLQSISNKQIREQIMKKYSRIAKHSTHLQMKKMIDLFAANNPTSEEIFSEYVNLLFSNLSKDVNLQEFLRFFSSNFFLNGQSQQILRVLDKITVLFYNHQPLSNRILKTSDATYTFANAIILLNADLHNPQNQQKMSLESFYKICKRINAGDDLPTQILTQTYTNIKKNKINTFRQKSQMNGISPSNFVLICNKEEENRLDFYDLEMRMLNDENFYNFWAFDLLSGIIDERETMKLEQLIERFVYDDNSYECEVIELVRKLVKKKPHIPLHAFEKILQHANFKNSRTSEKTISYLWLAVNMIETFSSHLPTNVICQLLIFTWRMRSQIKDDLYLRQKAEIKRVKKMVREHQKRQSKKSIMDMFSSFLSSKEEESQPEIVEEFNMSQTSIKKMNHKVLTEKVMEVLIKSGSSHGSVRMNHRVKAIEFFIGYLRNDEQKIFEEFLALLYMIFHLLYKFEINPIDKDYVQKQTISQTNEKQPQQGSAKKRPSTSLSLNLSTQLNPSQYLSLSQFSDTIEDLFYELLGLKESSITKRIENLKKKDVKKYEVLQSYCHYWVLKILINKIEPKGKVDLRDIENIGSHSKIQQNNQFNKSATKQNNKLYLLNKSIEYMQKTDKEIYLDLVYEFEQKAIQAFSISFTGRVTLAKSIKQQKVFNEQKVLKENSVNKVNDKSQVPDKFIKTKSQEVLVIRENMQQVQLTKNISLPQKLQDQAQITQSLQKSQQINRHQNPIVSKPQSSTSELSKQKIQRTQKSNQQHPEEQDLNHQEIIESFIFNYRKLILQFYVNCIRVLGKEEMKKKEWRWLIELQKMIQQVMENYSEKISHRKQSSQSYQGKTAKKLQEKKQHADINGEHIQKKQSIDRKEENIQKGQYLAKDYDSNEQNKLGQIAQQPLKQNEEKPTNIPNQILQQQSNHQADQPQQDLIQRINRQLSQNPSPDQSSKVQERDPVNQDNLDLSDSKLKTQILSNLVEPSQLKPQQYQPIETIPDSLQKNIDQNLSQSKAAKFSEQVKQKDEEISTNIQKQSNLMKEEEQAIKKLMEMYPAGCQSSQMLGMPFYML